MGRAPNDRVHSLGELLLLDELACFLIAEGHLSV
jgi:hypothetical protein